jgi:hypothetical protein
MIRQSIFQLVLYGPMVEVAITGSHRRIRHTDSVPAEARAGVTFWRLVDLSKVLSCSALSNYPIPLIL